MMDAEFKSIWEQSVKWIAGIVFYGLLLIPMTLLFVTATTKLTAGFLVVMMVFMTGMACNNYAKVILAWSHKEKKWDQPVEHPH
jgi:hypothetical protein